MKVEIRTNLYGLSRIGAIENVFLYIEPVSLPGSRLVLIKKKAGARALDSKDKVIYCAPDFDRTSSLNDYCWVRVDCHPSGRDEAIIVDFKDNASAIGFLQKEDSM